MIWFTNAEFQKKNLNINKTLQIFKLSYLSLYLNYKTSEWYLERVILYSNLLFKSLDRVKLHCKVTLDIKLNGQIWVIKYTRQTYFIWPQKRSVEIAVSKHTVRSDIPFSYLIIFFITLYTKKVYAGMKKRRIFQNIFCLLSPLVFFKSKYLRNVLFVCQIEILFELACYLLTFNFSWR